MTTSYFERYAALLGEVREFNDRQFSEHADTPQGVGWNSSEVQSIRFEQLVKVISESEVSPAVSLNDIGCGYGALLEFLGDQGLHLDYRGYDNSHDLVAAARERHRDSSPDSVVFKSLEELSPAAYSVASGLFGIRLGHDDATWHDYIADTLDLFDANSDRGFSFNMLTSYSDEDKREDELYYADPARYFDLCKRSYSKNVALYHDYSLFDFTIVVRKG